MENRNHQQVNIRLSMEMYRWVLAQVNEESMSDIRRLIETHRAEVEKENGNV